MAEFVKDSSFILETFKSQVKVSVEMVPQMPEDQKKQAWLFWQEISKCLQGMISSISNEAPVIEHQGTSILADGERKIPEFHEFHQVVSADSKETNILVPDSNITVLKDEVQDNLSSETGVPNNGIKEINIVIEAEPLSLDQEPAKKCSKKSHCVTVTKSKCSPAILRKAQTKKGKRKAKKVLTDTIPVESSSTDFVTKNNRSSVCDSVFAALQEANQTLGGENTISFDSMEEGVGDNSASGIVDEESSDEKDLKGNSRIPPKGCEHCGKAFPTHSALLIHLRTHTGEKPFPCSLCDKAFTTKSNLVRHEKTHAGLKPFQCQECLKYFTEKKSLKIHMRVHTGEKPYKCEVCSRSFAQIGVLKTHMHLHTGYMGHLCDFCGKAFRQMSNLRIHMLRHKNKRQFACETCPASFICAAELKRHCQKHTGERPFLCWLCPKTFTRLQYLKEHINQHTGNKPYNCNKCNAAFPDLSSIYKHRKKEHGNKKTRKVAVFDNIEQHKTNLGGEELCLEVADSNFLQYDSNVMEVHFPPGQKVLTDSTFCTEGEKEVRLTILNIPNPDAFDGCNIVYVPVSEVPKTEVVSTNPSLGEGESGVVDFSAISMLASASAQVEAATEEAVKNLRLEEFKVDF